ncbi:L-seryl-tRNA(Sec) selenium transferase [Nonomuraea sp. NPDC050478]|uniref:L-seryl-tRNA(Sec) selenium transferase n=1 Tax=Nonomuraea sp. NPDC050478 TaxID=3364365 RepID=UPI00378F851A
MTDQRRRIPRTDAVLADPRLAELTPVFGRSRVKAAVTAAQRRARDGEIDPELVAETALASLSDAGPRRVINATGVVVHTNLGRAPLSGPALEAVRVAAGSTDVELDLVTGRRGRRGRGALAALAQAVPAAEAVHVVNNNAAALVLAATALAYGKEIVISRGELVEIGAGFRLPELLESTGARLREVGTTNRTTVADYRAAIGPVTGFVLKVHPSNYRVEGFGGTPGVGDLAGLGVPVVGDIGSGLLRPEPALPAEPDAATWLEQGADLVTASGDKLLGGPQCGLLLGRTGLVERLRTHPLARALRVDKLTLAALEATLTHAANPTRAALLADLPTLRRRADELLLLLHADGVKADAVDTVAAVGGGGAPGVELPSVAVTVPIALAGPLRTGTPAVVGRAAADRYLLDLRAVAPDDDGDLAAAVAAAWEAAACA